MENLSLPKFAFINTDQLTSKDIQKLLEAKYSPDNPVVFRASILDADLFVKVSEEEEYRDTDFADYSPQMKHVAEWAAQNGVLYLLISNDCPDTDLTTANINESHSSCSWSLPKQVREAVATAATAAQATESEVVEEVLTDWAGL